MNYISNTLLVELVFTNIWQKGLVAAWCFCLFLCSPAQRAGEDYPQPWAAAEATSGHQ